MYCCIYIRHKIPNDKFNTTIKIVTVHIFLHTVCICGHLQRAQDQALKEPLEASIHKEQDGWCSIMNNAVANMKQMALGHLESRRAIKFQPRQILRATGLE